MTNKNINQEKQYKCSTCHLIFKNYDYFYKHLESHEKCYKIFQCCYCESKFGKKV